MCAQKHALVYQRAVLRRAYRDGLLRTPAREALDSAMHADRMSEVNELIRKTQRPANARTRMGDEE